MPNPDLRFNPIGIPYPNWEEVTLGDFLIRDEAKIPIEQGKSYRAVGVLRSGRGLKEKETLTTDNTQYKNLVMVSTGQVVLRTLTAFEAPVAVVEKQYDGMFVTPSVFPVYTVDRNIALPEILKQIFQLTDFHKEITDRVTGTVLRRKSISPEKFCEIPVYLPSISEQQRIAEFLELVDGKLVCLRAEADQWRAYKRGLMQSLFTQRLRFTDVNGQPYPSWEETTLGKILEEGLLSDGDWVESKDQDPIGKVRLLQLADVGDGIFLNKSNRWMNDEQATRLRVTYLEKGDLLVARMPDPIARCCMVPDELGKAATVVDVAILRSVNRNLDNAFLMQCINSASFREKALANASGTTRTRISRSKLANLSFLLPSLAEQQRIAELLSAVDTKIAILDAQVVLWEQEKRGLMQGLFV